jgi:hypothetical protein
MIRALRSLGMETPFLAHKKSGLPVEISGRPVSVFP